MDQGNADLLPCVRLGELVRVWGMGWDSRVQQTTKHIAGQTLNSHLQYTAPLQFQHVTQTWCTVLPLNCPVKCNAARARSPIKQPRFVCKNDCVTLQPSEWLLLKSCHPGSSHYVQRRFFHPILFPCLTAHVVSTQWKAKQIPLASAGNFLIHDFFFFFDTPWGISLIPWIKLLLY